MQLHLIDVESSTNEAGELSVAGLDDERWSTVPSYPTGAYVDPCAIVCAVTV